MTDDPNAVANLAAAATHNSSGILVMLVPVVAIVMGLGALMLGLWLDYRKKRDFYQLHHAERMAAIEKGIELPPLPPEFFQSNRRFPATPTQQLYRGLLCLFLGAGFLAAPFVSGGLGGSMQLGDHVTTGLLLIAAGAANLLFCVLNKRSATDTAMPTTKDAQ